MRLFTTLHNYKKELFGKGFDRGRCNGGSVYSNRHGICGSIGPSGRLWAVWFGTSDSFDLPAFRHRHSLSLAWMPHRQQLLAPV